MVKKKTELIFAHHDGEEKTNSLTDTESIFGNEKIQYPLTFGIKIIMNTEKSDEDNKKTLIELFLRLGIPFSEWKYKKSGKGNYISFTVIIKVENEELMHLLYEELKKIPEVKYAL